MMMYCKILFVFFCFSVHATDETGPHKALIADLGKQAIDILTNQNSPQKEKKLRFEEIFNKIFAVQAIAKFVLGKYGRTATPAEKEKFLLLFKKEIVDTYAARFNAYNKETFEVVEGRSIGEKGVRVKSQILRPGTSPVIVEWKIYPDKQGNLRVFDVIVEGISMSTTQRAEYDSIIQNNGGTVADLNRILEKKI